MGIPKWVFRWQRLLNNQGKTHEEEKIMLIIEFGGIQFVEKHSDKIIVTAF